MALGTGWAAGFKHTAGKGSIKEIPSLPLGTPSALRVGLDLSRCATKLFPKQKKVDVFDRQ